MTGIQIIDTTLTPDHADKAGRFNMLTGVAGSGKSHVLMHIALHEGLSGIPTLYITTDVTPRNLQHSVFQRTGIRLTDAPITIMAESDSAVVFDAITGWLAEVPPLRRRNGCVVCIDGLDMLSDGDTLTPGAVSRRAEALASLAETECLTVWATVQALPNIGPAKTAPRSIRAVCIADSAWTVEPFEAPGCVDARAFVKVRCVKARNTPTAGKPAPTDYSLVSLRAL